MVKTPSAHLARTRTRIQAKNEKLIVTAALDVFSTYGYSGATVDRIAASAGMSKANVLYYFGRKQDIYEAVLERTLKVWLDPLRKLDPNGDPIDELWRYTEMKLKLSREAPHASRLFANEILRGAPVIRGFLETELRELVAAACATIQAWIDAGKLANVEPVNLIFLIWAATQHYADFEPQILALESDANAIHEGAIRTLRRIIEAGLAPDPEPDGD